MVSKQPVPADGVPPPLNRNVGIMLNFKKPKSYLHYLVGRPLADRVVK
jgi:hypothetical protein